MDIDPSWWPESLPHLVLANPPKSGYMAIGDIGSPWNEKDSVHVYTGLVPLERLNEVKLNPGGIGTEVYSTTHPHISPGDNSTYNPMAWISGPNGHQDKLEPLTLSWSLANRETIRIDQGFLLTYGLTPRFVEATKMGEHIEIWDDLSLPTYDVVKSKIVSYYEYPVFPPAFIHVRREYLQDYSTIRQRALVRVFYTRRWTNMNPEADELLGKHQSWFVNLPARNIRFWRDLQDGALLTEIWGVEHLLSPDTAPITIGRWEYGELEWPGLEGPITQDMALRSRFSRVYFSDRVLGEYEGHKEFQIIPQIGSVGYGGQWSTADTFRIGRDIISADLKKLYEGIPTEVTKLWNKYAVEPPQGEMALRDAPNVALRAERILFGLLSLGEQLGVLASRVLGQFITSHHTVGIEREYVEYNGWWTFAPVEPVTRHLPIDISEDAFLDRSVHLDQLISDRLNESILRRTLVELGALKEEIKDFRSLKLMELLINAILVSRKTGLDLESQGEEIFPTLLQNKESVDVLAPLFALKTFRNLESHTKGKKYMAEIDVAMAAIGASRSETASGWGGVADKLYDELGHSLEGLSELIG